MLTNRSLCRPTAPRLETGQQAESSGDFDRLASETAVSLAGSLAGRGFNFACYAALARLLGPAGFGLYAVAAAAVQLLEGLARLGLSNGVLRWGALYRSNDPTRLRQVLRLSVTVAFCSGLSAGALLLVFGPWLGEAVFTKPSVGIALCWFALALPATTTLRVVTAGTRVALRTKFAAFAGDVVPAVVNLVLLGFVWLGGGNLSAAIAARVGSLAAGAALTLYFLNRLFPGWFLWRGEAGLAARRLVSFSIPTALASILSGLLITSDRLFLGVFREASEAGVYQAAAQLSLTLGFLLAAVNTIFAPMAAAMHQQGQIRRLQELFRASTKWGLYSTIPFFLIVVLVPRELLAVVYGEAYSSAAWPLLILAFGQLVNVATGSAGSTLNMSGHPRKWLAASLGAVVVNLVLNALWVPRFGAIGAAGATAAAMAFLFTASLAQVRRVVGIWPYDRGYLRGLIAAVPAAAVVLLLAATSVPDAVVLLSAGVLAPVVFASSLLLFGLEPRERQVLLRIGKRITPKFAYGTNRL